MTKTRLISIFLLLIGAGLIVLDMFTELHTMIWGIGVIIISCVLELFVPKKRSK